MRNLSLMLLTPLAAACASMAPATPPSGDACAPDSLARYIGQIANDALAARMKRDTGKTELRWVRAGMAVTMDYREDRLTVYLDAANKVERGNCS